MAWDGEQELFVTIMSGDALLCSLQATQSSGLHRDHTHNASAQTCTMHRPHIVMAPLALLLLFALPAAEAHSVLLSPMPRNAVDRFLPGWAGGHFGNATCAHPSTENSTTQKPV